MATREQLRSAMHQQPWRGFTIRLTDGRSFRVHHPDFISVPISDRGRDVVVHDAGGLVLLDLLHIVSVDIPEPSPAAAEGGE